MYLPSSPPLRPTRLTYPSCLYQNFRDKNNSTPSTTLHPPRHPTRKSNNRRPNTRSPSPKNFHPKLPKINLLTYIPINCRPNINIPILLHRLNKTLHLIILIIPHRKHLTITSNKLLIMRMSAINFFNLIN